MIFQEAMNLLENRKCVGIKRKGWVSGGYVYLGEFLLIWNFPQVPAKLTTGDKLAADWEAILFHSDDEGN